MLLVLKSLPLEFVFMNVPSPELPIDGHKCYVIYDFSLYCCIFPLTFVS